MSVSAWGVEHGEVVSKARYQRDDRTYEQKATNERLRLRADVKGELVGGAAGLAAGAGLGAAATRVRPLKSGARAARTLRRNGAPVRDSLSLGRTIGRETPRGNPRRAAAAGGVGGWLVGDIGGGVGAQLNARNDPRYTRRRPRFA